MSYQTLKLAKDARGVLTVSIHRPDVRNAFNAIMIDELLTVFTQEAAKTEVRLVVLRGEGPVFCAGGDLAWMKQSVNLSLAENFKETQKLTLMFQKMNECPKPVIGAIHGAAIGGGVGLVSVCDIAIATQETSFSLSEVRLGIIPACIGPFVIAKIGPSYAREMFISAERFQAQRAKEVGLVHRVVKDEQELEKELQKLVNNMLQCGPEAMAIAKRFVLSLSWPEQRNQIPNVYDYVAKLLAELRVSPEGQEGLKAFLEKRKPNWIS